MNIVFHIAKFAVSILVGCGSSDDGQPEGAGSATETSSQIALEPSKQRVRMIKIVKKSASQPLMMKPRRLAKRRCR